MALDTASADKFTKFINEKWKTKNCPLCASNSWAVSGYTAISLSTQPHGVASPLGGEVLPSVAVVCRVCGNTLLVNALVSGVFEAGGGPK